MRTYLPSAIDYLIDAVYIEASYCFTWQHYLRPVSNVLQNSNPHIKPLTVIEDCNEPKIQRHYYCRPAWWYVSFLSVILWLGLYWSCYYRSFFFFIDFIIQHFSPFLPLLKISIVMQRIIKSTHANNSFSISEPQVHN